ncbi:MAG: hypothetical protein L0Y71_20655 [Gemmataceae bacterium]|nr:hypothetical protein [Gemmataceae bacterium]
MKRLFVALFVVGVVIAGGAWLAAQPAATQPAPHESAEAQLDFVRRLRSKGYHDLASEYIDGLMKTHPQLAGQLSLEQARSLVALARTRSLDQRTGLFNQARDKFQAFVAQHEGKPEAVQARLELAKLVAYHGQALLSKALREHEDPKDQHDAARRAEPLFVQAGQALDVVIKQLKDKEQIQAKLDRAVNFIDQARTHIDIDKTATLRRRAELVEEARKMFVDLAAEEKTDVGLLANAWLVKCYQEAQDPTAAEKHLKKVVGSDRKTPMAVAAQRLARYFDIQWILKNPNLNKLKAMERVKLIQTEAAKWIKDFGPLSVKTWEGQGVRFELANALILEAQLTYKNLQAPAATPLLNRAFKYYNEVAAADGDFSEEAQRRVIGISVTKLENKKREEIRDFDNSLLKAYYELYAKIKQIREKLADDKTAAAERKKLETARKHSYREAALALKQALNFADGSTPIEKVAEARQVLMAVYFDLGDLHRAAVAGEALGRSRPPTKRAPQGIGGALLAYDILNTREPGPVNRQKLRDLVEFVLSPESQKFWHSDPVTSVARYQLAMLAHKDDDYKTALDNLDKLAPDFKGFVYAQGQLAFIALGTAGDTNKELSDKERDQLRARARAAIRRMPSSLPGDADVNTATMYFHAQMEEAKALYKDAAEHLNVQKLPEATAKYRQMGKFVDHHFNTFNKSNLEFEKDTRSKLTTLMSVLGRYAKLGLADVDYRLADYDKVLSFDGIGPYVTEIKARAAKVKEGKVRIKEHVVAGETLALALRTYVQKADVVSAKQIFDIIERLAPEDDGGLDADGNESTRLMFQLIGDIEQYVKTLKKGRDPAKLQAAVENYSKFIDAIAESILKRRTRPQDYTFLANFYATVGQPQKASELYERVPTPKQIQDVDAELDRRYKAKKPGYTDDEIAKLKAKLADDAFKKHPELAKLEAAQKAATTDEEIAEIKTKIAQLKTAVGGEVGKERQNYWYLQIQLGGALRQAQDYKKAYATLQRIVAHPLGEYLILAEMEKNFVLEDSDRLGTAIKEWNTLMNRLREKAGVDTAIKQLYFECYFYNARCWYKYSQTAKVLKDGKEQQFLAVAARYILALENSKSKEGWDMVGGRFADLMDAEPKLKTAYEKMKKDMAASAAATGK